MFRKTWEIGFICYFAFFTLYFIVFALFDVVFCVESKYLLATIVLAESLSGLALFLVLDSLCVHQAQALRVDLFALFDFGLICPDIVLAFFHWTKESLVSQNAVDPAVELNIISIFA